MASEAEDSGCVGDTAQGGHAYEVGGGPSAHTAAATEVSDRAAKPTSSRQTSCPSPATHTRTCGSSSSRRRRPIRTASRTTMGRSASTTSAITRERTRSEEHTSELQSRLHLVCRLLLEKKKT